MSAGNRQMREMREMMRERDAGFTLIEVMIAILLTVIAIIGILALYMTQSKASSYTRHTTEASTLAADKLEQLRTTSAPIAGSEPTIDGTGVVGGLFERAWEVTPVGTYQDLTVYVGWSEDEAAGASCSTHAACAVSLFCRPSTGQCASRAVIVRGRRNQ